MRGLDALVGEHERHHAFDAFRVGPFVRVEPREEFPGGEIDGPVSGDIRTDIVTIENQTDSRIGVGESACHLRGAVGAGVVDEDEFKGLPSLIEDGGDCELKRRLGIVYRHVHRDERALLDAARGAGTEAKEAHGIATGEPERFEIEEREVTVEMREPSGFVVQSSVGAEEMPGAVVGARLGRLRFLERCVVWRF